MIRSLTFDYVGTPVVVASVKDMWDWLLYGASLVAAVTALVLFLPWALERRRRPEISIMWQLSKTVSPEHLRDWPAGEVLELEPGGQVLVAASIRNVGDLQGDKTQVNLVVPNVFGIGMECEDPWRVDSRPSRNGTAGLAPTFAVNYLNPEVPIWTPGNFHSIQFRLWVAQDMIVDAPINGRILFAIADPKFNGTGKRWLPSLLSAGDLTHSPAGSPWPPRGTKRFKRWPRWVHVEPKHRVLCTYGERSDIRDVRIIPRPDNSPGDQETSN